MYKTLTSIFGAAVLLVGITACNPQDVQKQATAIRQAAIAICGFEPQVAEVISAVAPKTAPTVSGVSQIAQVICDQVTNKVGANRYGVSASAVVNGVRITGRFVR